MKFGDIIKCSECGSSIKESSIEVIKTSITNESNGVEDYFAGDDEKLCRKVDNIFAKGYCPKCNKTVELMILVDIKPIKCYSADTRAKLTMIKE